MVRGVCSGCRKPIGDNEDYVVCSKCGAMMHRLAKCMVCKGDERYCPSCGAYIYTSSQLEEKEKKTTVEKTLSISFSTDAILMRLAPEARKVLDKFPKEVKHSVMKRAIELSKKKGRDYDVRLEDVIEAENERELKKREGKS